MRPGLLALLAAAAAAAVSTDVISQVRSAIAQKNFAAAEAAIKDYRSRDGVTPELAEAVSWMGRGTLAEKNYDAAERYAAEARGLALQLLKSRPLDSEKHLPIALGAAIEVHAHVLAFRGQLSEAIQFLNGELNSYRETSIRTRIQKNIHLLSLEGKSAPPLDVKHWVGPKAPPPLEKLRGRPVLLFFWAHWCGDCKEQVPILAKIQKVYGPRGLVILAPTQLYGYAAQGEEAAPRQETAYIEQVRRRYYSDIAGVAAPLSQENFKIYGASITPTLVVLDRQGAVRFYHPGNAPYETLAARIDAALKR